MTRRAPRIVHLDEIEAIPGPGTLTWHPVRSHLGLRAFGTNAYTAANLGDDVVEPHDENPDLAHEELYFVARGRARFILDGESFDAPAGTYVFVPDPATHRHAVAEEVGTTVLSFGGPPTFEPSAWEWMFRAVALTESDPAQAREIVEDGIEKHPESPGLRIALARVLLGEGDEDGARAALREALERQPDAEDYVRQDAALSALL
jgi:mannose-6-phosphate isomerase-like protein (cupin superfamily)